MSWKQTPEWQQKTFKTDAIRIASALNKAGIFYSLEWIIPRYGEYRNGHPLSYVVDIMVIDEKYVPTAIEIEGEGSSSRDNSKRDAYLSTLGIRVLHVDNRTPAEEVLIRLDASFRRKDIV